MFVGTFEHIISLTAVIDAQIVCCEALDDVQESWIAAAVVVVEVTGSLAAPEIQLHALHSMLT